MVHNNKILTVSYGTFSCTLEGFDDSFGTMKAIAEYFRDLASDDRYFGAEPPVPEAEMLAQIAQKEIARRVEARKDDSGTFVLKARDAAPPAALPTAPPAASVATQGLDRTDPLGADGHTTPAEAQRAGGVSQSATPSPEAFVGKGAPEPFQDTETDEEYEAALPDRSRDSALQDAVTGSGDLDVPVFDAEIVDPNSSEADSIAAKLQRIRAVVSRNQEPESTARSDGARDYVDAVVQDITEALGEQNPAQVEDGTEAEQDSVSPETAAQVTNAPGADGGDTAQQDAKTVSDDTGNDSAIMGSAADDDAGAETAPSHAPYVLGQDAQVFPRTDTGGETDEQATAPALSDNATEIEDALPVAEDDHAPAHLDSVAEQESATASCDDPADTSDRADFALQDVATTEPGSEPDAISDEDDEVVAAETAIDETTEADATGAPEQTLEGLERSEGFSDDGITSDSMQRDTDKDEMTDDEPGADTPDALEPDKPVDTTGISTQEQEDAHDGPAPSRVIKVKRADFEAAIRTGDVEDLDEAAQHASGQADETDDLRRALDKLADDITAIGAMGQAHIADDVQATRMSEDDDSDATPDSQGPVSKVDETDEAGLEADETDERDDDVSRLLAAVDAKMDAPETADAHETFSALRGAVAAASEADASGQDMRPDTPDPEDAYRADLSDIVRPRRPVPPARSDKRPTSDLRPAPLQLVPEQRVDTDAARDTHGPVRPRRVASAEIGQESAGSAGGTFEEFAEEMNVEELPDLLEAAAAYLVFVEGRAQFSRPQLMNKVRQIDAVAFNREDSLRTFGRLLRDGKIEKTGGGRFTASGEIGFRPDECTTGQHRHGMS